MQFPYFSHFRRYPAHLFTVRFLDRHTSPFGDRDRRIPILGKLLKNLRGLIPNDLPFLHRPDQPPKKRKPAQFLNGTARVIANLMIKRTQLLQRLKIPSLDQSLRIFRNDTINDSFHFDLLYSE